MFQFLLKQKLIRQRLVATCIRGSNRATKSQIVFLAVITSSSIFPTSITTLGALTFSTTSSVRTTTTTTTTNTILPVMDSKTPTTTEGMTSVEQEQEQHQADTMKKPSLPLRYDNEVAQQVQQLDLSTLSNEISIKYEQKQDMYSISRDIQTSILQIRNHIGTDHAQNEITQLIQFYRSPKDNNVMEVQDMETTTIQSTISTNKNHNPIDILTWDKATNRIPRVANLSYTVEDLIRTVSYQHFLQTGTVMSPVPYCTDEEYLVGAIMGLCSDLQQYGLGRATVRDVQSVQMACTVVTACMEYLLLYDFRNGPLRRKYDGCKYSLKALETFLYELAVTSPTTAIDPSSSKQQESESKVTLRLENILPMKELMALKERMDYRDELRETLIKKCRDGQKLAKQCIFALHRNDRIHAQALLQQCCSYIQKDLLPIINEEPPLRYGSFASVLEEYVEAKLFYTWLHGRNSDTIIQNDGTTDNNQASGFPKKADAANPAIVAASGILLAPHDFMMDDFIQLEPEEYIGGLCDLTGEIGRYAVQRGTVRDVPSIKQCLYSNTIILNAIQSMDRLSSSGGNSSIMKKMDTVKQSVQKIERMLYEISLSEAAGHGRMIQTSAPTIEATTNEEE